MPSIAKKLTKLPKSPGVYFFKDKTGQIIYIGKAGNLRNRVRSYFNKGAKFSSAAKVKMLSEIVNIEILKTDSEIEALIKESELIKKHKPKFNVLMRDSKNYLFVMFTKDKFSKIILTHQPVRNLKLGISNYIGPFTDPGATRATLRFLRNIFPYCACKQKHNTKCLNAHLGKCLTVCCLKNPADVSPAYDRMLAIRKQYRKNIRAIRAILSGRSQILLKNLKKEIKAEIKKQNFEKAQELKYQIAGLENILKHAHVLTEKWELSPPIFQDIKPNFELLGFKKDPLRIEMYDISNFQGQAAVGSMVVFNPDKNRNYKPNKNEYRRFKIKTVIGINDPAMLAEVIKRRLAHLDWPLPQLIIVDGGRTQLNAAMKVLATCPTLDVGQIKIIGLAKKLEEIYLPERTEPVLANKFGQNIKHLFQAIRDEAHRFAISYHRKIHRKILCTSSETYETP